MKTFITLTILTGMLAIVSPTLARTLSVNCDTGGAIGQTLKRARPGDTILVTLDFGHFSQTQQWGKTTAIQGFDL